MLPSCHSLIIDDDVQSQVLFDYMRTVALETKMEFIILDQPLSIFYSFLLNGR